ncbi:kelch-like protein diablo isoform X2 [Cydia pomonella]|uniref:kelch-like protein diablo isoform X2 n=1 Tax=Cydia pomonella TaxID=82600 RepID=UPI002ADD8BDB|nr:kelch-like protein diablo isoform X2 [Cydia pomonella]
MSEKHPRGGLFAFRRHRELCDVVLHVANRKLFAHRVILSACSPYFRAMFTGELAESRATEVTIRDVDEQAMEQLVEFCYTAHIVVEESNVQALLPAACLLQLQEIQDVCCEFLKRQLDCSNCLGIRAFADTHSCRELLRIADKFTQQNFPEVMESEEFLLLPAAQLIDIVSSDELNVRSEEQTFQAVMSWVKYNVAERRQHLAQVLQHVRLPLLSPKFLVGTVSSELLIRSDDACRDLLDEAKNYLLLPQERPLMQGPRTRPRKPTRRGQYTGTCWTRPRTTCCCRRSARSCRAPGPGPGSPPGEVSTPGPAGRGQELPAAAAGAPAHAGPQDQAQEAHQARSVHRDLLDEAKNYLLLPQERPLMQGPRTRPRKPTRRGQYTGTCWTRPRTTCCCRRSARSCRAPGPGPGSPPGEAKCCSRWAAGARATPSRPWSASSRRARSGRWWRPCPSGAAAWAWPCCTTCCTPWAATTARATSTASSATTRRPTSGVAQ